MLLEWVSHLGFRGLQPKTIKNYLSGIRSLHVDEGLPFDACESETVQRAIRGIKRFFGEKDRVPKHPITLDVLQKLASVAGNRSCIFDASFDAATKVAWAGFLRCGEFTLRDKEAFNPAVNLTRESVTFVPSLENPTHVRLDLPASKTDPFRKGVSILIGAAPGHSTCPVEALKFLFTDHPLPLNSPLFSGLTSDSPLTYNLFVSTLKERLTAAGVDPTGFVGHSFRRGAATAAAAVGFADHEIQLLGRWRSDAYKLYIDVPRDRILGLSSRLHGACAAAAVPEPPSLHLAAVLA